MEEPVHKIIFPRPFAIAIDDLGWMKGEDHGEDGYGPYRLGMGRNPTLKDYLAVIDIARQCGIRLQGLFILSELDRENVLKDFPTTTYLRENWDNSDNISDLQVEMMQCIKRESAFLEFGLHGTGHEFWPEEGKRNRAEWYNTDDKHPWPEEQLLDHLNCFVKIMGQYGLTIENGHSFPESFVPCAYSYYWNPQGAYSLGSLLNKFGVKYANTDFSQIPELNPPSEPNGGGFDHGVHVLNRYNYKNLWNETGKLPEVPLEEQETDFIETHWPNLLGNDEPTQAEISLKWINYFREVQKSPGRYCSKNTLQHHSQWLYNKYTSVAEIAPGIVEIDNTGMPEEAFKGALPGNLILKVSLNPGQHVSVATLNNKPITGYVEIEGYAHLYLPPMMNQKYELKYQLGDEIPSRIVWHDGTFNVLALEDQNEVLRLDLIFYGRQTVKLSNLSHPRSVLSDNPKLKVLDWHVDGNMLCLDLLAHNIQGETGSLYINYV